MKKILLTVAVTAALISCQKAEFEQQKTDRNEARTVTAYFEEPLTRTIPTLDADSVSLKPAWAVGDSIRLLNGSGAVTIKVTDGTPEQTDYAVIDDETGKLEITTTLAGTLYAVYPASATDAASQTGDNVPVTIPDTLDGTFASANICVAKENNGSLAFRNVTAILLVQQSDPDATKVDEIKIVAPAGTDYIVGTGTVDMSAETPSLLLSSDCTNRITVKTDTAKTDYYIAIAPCTLPEGTAFGFDNTADRKLGGANLDEEKVIVANTVYHIGSVDASAIAPNVYHDYVEINGLKWATMNVGADVPEDNGWYFSWGNVQGYVRNDANNGWVTASDSTLLEGGFSEANYYGSGRSIANGDAPTEGGRITQQSDWDVTGNDAARANWGGIWRMPTGNTDGEFKKLCDATEWVWNGSSNGYDVRKKGEGANVLFFPAVGAGEGKKIVTSDGYYWSSTSEGVQYSYYLLLSDEVKPDASFNRRYGFPVRPVAD